MIQLKITVKTVLVLVALFVLGLTPAISQSYQDKVEKDSRIELVRGDIPPDFTAVDFQGNQFTLSDMIGEKPVVLDFWATWCPPCRMEMPLLNQFTETFGEDVAVLSITSEAEASRDTIVAFIQDNNYKMHVIQDSSGAIAESYGATAIPFVVVIDIDGKIRATHLGYSKGLAGELVNELDLEPPASWSVVPF
jgi:thiol-disulfide isomerase/thioredoxin